MRSASVVSLLLLLALATAQAQHQHEGHPDSAVADSATTDSGAPAVALAPPPPTEEQERYLDGLRRVGRGIAQLRTALERATRAAASRDTVSQRRASGRLGGYCGSARRFMVGGRGQMDAAAYADTTRIKARKLAQAVDDLIKYAPTCESLAATETVRVAEELTTRLKTFDEAHGEFRTAIGLPALN